MIHEKDKKEPSESLAGTYEETYSNWRNKVEEAAEQNNVFASFINMCNLQYIFTENRKMQQVTKIYFNVRLIY